MSRCLLICFEHDRGVKREIEPPCFDLDIDVRVPWSWLDATIGSVSVRDPADTESIPLVAVLPEQRPFEGTLASVSALADRYQPVCPACKEPLHYVAWSIEDLDEDSEGSP